MTIICNSEINSEVISELTTPSVKKTLEKSSLENCTEYTSLPIDPYMDSCEGCRVLCNVLYCDKCCDNDNISYYNLSTPYVCMGPIDFNIPDGNINPQLYCTTSLTNY